MLPRSIKSQLLVFLALCAFCSNNLIAQNDSRVKNVVLIVSDDLKASVLGCYGDKVCQTPAIDRLAKEGMVFQRAYCQGTWCAPSRQSFMHSRYQSGGKINLGMHLQSKGLHSSRVGKIYHMRVPGDIIAGTDGNDIQSTWTERFNSTGQEAHTPGSYACLNLDIFTEALANRESTKMPNRPYVTVKCEGDGSDQPDFKSAATALKLLQKRKVDQQPFFLAVGLVRPHYPMVAPEQYFEKYPLDKITLPETREDDWDDIPKMGRGQSVSSKNKMDNSIDNQKRMWAGYYASVTFMDEQVGKILDELDRLKMRESTAVIFISDHGYHLGEHEFWQKSNLHEEVARVPMIISAPGFQTGTTLALSELVDIYPTISKLLGFEYPEAVQGKNLIPILKDPLASVREHAVTISKAGLAIRSDQWAYMRYSDKTEELYNMSSDPNQFTNLVANEAFANVLQEQRLAFDLKTKNEGLVMATKKKKK